MDDAELIARERRSQRECYRSAYSCFGADARAVEIAPGLLACVVPATPHASITNAVVYDDPRLVLDRHDELLALYADAGCAAWTVWVRPGDDALVDGLHARGHRLDAEPALMAAVIDDLELDSDGPDALDLDPEPAWADAGPINEAAYATPPGAFAPAFADVAAGMPLRPLVARLDGAPAACAAWLPTAEGDCSIQVVATLPQAQGRGLASDLLREALRRARDHGCTTTSLEGSPAGTPVYERLGYRTLGRLRMLEHRRPAP